MIRNSSNKEYIYPPDPRKKLDIAYFNTILELLLGVDITRYMEKSGTEKLFVIHLRESNGVEVSFGILIKNAKYVKNDLSWQQMELEMTLLRDNSYKQVEAMTGISKSTFLLHFFANLSIL